MARCDTCLANKVCDHDRFGFENCGNYISENNGVAHDALFHFLLKQSHKDVEQRMKEHDAELARKIFDEIERVRMNMGGLKIKAFKITSVGKGAERTITGDIIPFSDVLEIKKKYEESCLGRGD